ncbi:MULTISPECIES: hypothetical protein [Thermodesulfovibrio]|jgi:uncharacterized membrane protein required for colicin V production|uniref:hypothetical protein n=1 Tax=Thermodesulfovibrio TaxID=28261 RepID=UPI00048C1613|nr:MULTISPECIES: hypothetical protein [Thermodesulfovibrio]MDI6864480.1 hypothetical protein [Thermodesulfovibrio yellowstonii]
MPDQVLTNTIYFILLLPFSIIAAVMVYLITYNEYMHHYTTKKEPRKIALETAIFTFVFFIVVGFFIVYVLINWIEK